jgi:hypothetical protein
VTDRQKITIFGKSKFKKINFRIKLSASHNILICFQLKYNL